MLQTHRGFLSVSIHTGDHSAHLMHMWNCFTGVRSGDHVSISSYSEPKFYHLLVFKAKNTQLTWLHRRRKHCRESFMLAGLGYSSSMSHPRRWTQCLLTRRKWNAHVSGPPLPSSSQAEPFCYSHRDPRTWGRAKRRDTAVSFLEQTVYQNLTRSYEKAMLWRLATLHFDTQV